MKNLLKNSNAIHILAKLNYKKIKDNWIRLLEKLTSYVFNLERMIRFSEKLYFFEKILAKIYSNIFNF